MLKNVENTELTYICYNGRIKCILMLFTHEVSPDFGNFIIMIYLGLVVQNFVSLTLSLRPQFVNCTTSKAKTLLFVVEKKM